MGYIQEIRQMNNVLDYGVRKLEVYPDCTKEIMSFLNIAGLKFIETFNTEFATIIVAEK